MADHDVIIVGAGPVGLLLGCLLRAQGTDAVICERRPDDDPRTRAIGIHRPGLDALDAAGVGDAVRAEALRLEGGDVVSRGRVLAAMRFAPDRPVLTLPQQRTRALLRQRLDALAPDALRTQMPVVAVRDEGMFARVAVQTAEGRRELTAHMVVAADGVRSGIRTALGVGWRARSGVGGYAMADVPDADAGSRALLFCEPGGVVESFPLPGGMRRWVVRERGRALDSAGALRTAIVGRTGIRPSIGEDAIVTRFRAAQHLAERFAHGRIVLLGDAAHETSPIGGQGMNLGWADAVALAAVVNGSSAERAAALAVWERRARRSARQAQRRAAFYMAMGSPIPDAVVRGREGVIRALGTGPLRDWATGLVTMRGLQVRGGNG